MNENNKIIVLLRKLFASEWVAAYQYYYAYKLFSGMTKYSIYAEEFKKHYKEELEHAEKLIDRLIVLGGTPVEFLSGLELESPCKTEKFGTTFEEIVQALYISEKCAVKQYNMAIDIAREEKDYSTALILSEILITEEEHLSELFKLQ